MQVQVHSADVSSRKSIRFTRAYHDGDVGGPGWSLITRNTRGGETMRKEEKEEDRRSDEDRETRRVVGIPGRGGEGIYIGYADRRKGTSWWNNRSLARAIASARHCARTARQPRSAQWKRMNAGQCEWCKRAIRSLSLRFSSSLLGVRAEKPSPLGF